jgi:3'-phosphoadenosine 5'-phosphosulfate sulfotransferase (PAPS reductase)/FAD synthetase
MPPTLTNASQSKPVRHILSLSGGKDSTALAIHMKQKGTVPQMEYIFCDTGEELAETYDYLERLEAFLGKKITRLNPDRPFSHYLNVYRGVLPDSRTRWCTRMLKIKPFEDHVGNDPVVSYVGIRADEPHRKGYISTKPNITPCYPFIEDNLRHDDIRRILDESGIGLPSYYEWRSRSGCYFCFYQRRIEWAGLHERHPELFKKAQAFEKVDPATGEHFTWVEKESLDELAKPERLEAIRAEHKARQEAAAKSTKRKDGSLVDVFGAPEDDGGSCLICHL